MKYLARLLRNVDSKVHSAENKGLADNKLKPSSTMLNVDSTRLSNPETMPDEAAELACISQSLTSCCTVDLKECGIISSLIMRLESLLEPSHETIQPYSNCALFGKRCSSFVQRSSRFSQKSDQFVENIESIICMV